MNDVTMSNIMATIRRDISTAEQEVVAAEEDRAAAEERLASAKDRLATLRKFETYVADHVALPFPLVRNGQTETAHTSDEKKSVVAIAIRDHRVEKPLFYPGMKQSDAAAIALKLLNGPALVGAIVDKMMAMGFQNQNPGSSITVITNSVCSAMHRDPRRFKRIGRGRWELTDDNASPNSGGPLFPISSDENNHQT